MSRRGLLQAGAVAATLTGMVGLAELVAPVPTAAAVAPPSGESWWLGPDMWGNRLTDWALRDGAYTCLAQPGKRRLCTASLLTRRLTGDGAARLSVRTRTDISGSGFSGFLIGTGTDLEHRRTALVSTASGRGGGLLAVLGSDGAVGFRDHSDETDQLAFAPVAGPTRAPRQACSPGRTYQLQLDVTPVAPGRVDLLLTAVGVGGDLLSTAELRNVDAADVRGGLALVSSAAAYDGPTYALSGLVVEGAGVATDPTHELGPIVGTLFSLSGGVLKMTAQVAPFTLSVEDTVTLETQDRSGTWVVRTTAPVGAGFVAALRVEGWDAARATPYRVTHSGGGAGWGGTVPAEPGTRRPLRIATINCSKAAARPIDRPSELDGGLDGGAPLPLYGETNIYFPYEQTLANVAAQDPDVLVAMGDQYYETSPTAEDHSADPQLDFLYKYFLWLWAVRDLAKDRPTLVLVDDHDVFQGNLWGEGGLPAPGGNFRKGGYEKRADWVNLVQRVQCGHNPDPYDPTPVEQGINVYFTTFDYAGTTFVILEDRKFKTPSNGIAGDPDAPPEFLGRRQEAMLDDLARSVAGRDRPVVVLTQTIWACVETEPDGSVSKGADGGWPKAPRDRALASITQARGVVLSGDTHLSSLVRHLRLPDGGDGPMQFTGPALASTFQRWFEPSRQLPQRNSEPSTGRGRDGAGNAYLVHAVANPRIGQQEVVDRGSGPNVGDPALKREGYGMVEVDPRSRTVTFASWPGDVDPLGSGRPYPGWPSTLSFDDV